MVLRHLTVRFRLAFYRWAMQEISRTHPDVGFIMFRIRDLELELKQLNKGTLCSSTPNNKQLSR